MGLRGRAHSQCQDRLHLFFARLVKVTTGTLEQRGTVEPNSADPENIDCVIVIARRFLLLIDPNTYTCRLGIYK